MRELLGYKIESELDIKLLQGIFDNSIDKESNLELKLQDYDDDDVPEIATKIREESNIDSTIIERSNQSID